MSHHSSYDSNKYMNILVYSFEEALLRGRVFESNDQHIQKVKDYLAAISKLHIGRFQRFVIDSIEKIHESDGGLNLEGLTEELVETAIEWKIFKIENNLLKLNCHHRDI